MRVATVRTAVCLALWLCVCQVRGFHIPAEMNRTIHSLLQHYNVSSKLKFTGRPVFSRELLSGKMEPKRVFLSGVLEVYEKLFGQMLQDLPRSQTSTAVPRSSGDSLKEDRDVRSQLNYILKKVQELRKHNYQEQDNLLQKLHDLKEIKMNDVVVQNKALFELPLLYAEASSLPDDLNLQTKQKRRRRQTKKFRKIQRG